MTGLERRCGVAILAAAIAAAGGYAARGAEPSATELLRECLDRSGRRVMAMRMLTERAADDLRASQAVYTLMKEIAANRYQSGTIRAAAIDAVGDIVAAKVPDERGYAVPRLVKILINPSQKSAVRAASAGALGKVLAAGASKEHVARIMPVLVGAVEGRDCEVAAAAALALGSAPRRTHRARAAEALIAALEHRNDGVRAAAAKGLKALSGRDLGRDGAEWRRWLEAAAEGPSDPPEAAAEARRAVPVESGP